MTDIMGVAPKCGPGASKVNPAGTHPPLGVPVGRVWPAPLGGHTPPLPQCGPAGSEKEDTPPACCEVGDCPEVTVVGVACEAHAARLAALLGGGAGLLYVELHLALLPGTTGNDDPKTTTSKTKKLPLNANARSVQEDLLSALLEWESTLRAEMDWMRAPRRGREGPTLNAVCAVLLDHLPAALQVTDAGLHARDILRCAHQGQGALGRTNTRTNRLDQCCPACGERSLRRLNGSDDIACLCCAATLTAAAFDDLLDPPITEELAA